MESIMIYYKPLKESLWIITLPETNIAHETPLFPGKYHQKAG